jgi:hypothetical protein
MLFVLNILFLRHLCELQCIHMDVRVTPGFLLDGRTRVKQLESGSQTVRRVGIAESTVCERSSQCMCRWQHHLELTVILTSLDCYKCSCSVHSE